MTTHYTSQYLNIYPSHRDSCILFHGITGSIDEVTRALGKLLKKHQRSKTQTDASLPDSVIEFLSSRGHITTLSAHEEWAFFKTYSTELHQKVLEQNKDSLASFLIIPGYNCNLGCPYCFQKNNAATHSVMTTQTVDTIFERVLPSLCTHLSRPSHAQITLYGGEPFLKPHLPAISRIVEHTQKQQLRISAVTNGTHIDLFKNFFGIAKGLISQVQITLDGDQLTHDRSRKTKSGKGTYDQILKNIHMLIDRGVSVALRVNTTPDNIQSLTALWEHLTREEIVTNPLVTLYLAPIHDFLQSGCQPVFATKHKLTHYLEKTKSPLPSPQNEFTQKFKQVFNASSGIALNTTYFCMQNTGHAFAIDPHQRLYACYEEVGNPDLSVGQFDAQGLVHFNERYDLYKKRNVTTIEACSRCSLALSCGGGCSACARGNQQQDTALFTPACEGFKEMTAKTIRKLFEDKVEGSLCFKKCVPQTAANMPRI